MLGVVRIAGSAEAECRPPLRTWLVFFSDPAEGAWWSPLLRRGYRHVSAAAWYDRERRWVYFDPTRRGLSIELWRAKDFDGRLGEIALRSALILRVRGRFERGAMPPTFWCVGAVKALLGVRSRALLPATFARHLLANGAEIVTVPRADGTNDQPLQAAAAAAGRPEREASA